MDYVRIFLSQLKVIIYKTYDLSSNKKEKTE